MLAMHLIYLFLRIRKKSRFFVKIFVLLIYQLGGNYDS